MQKNPPNWLSSVVTDLRENDFCIISNAFSPDFCAALRADLRAAPLRPAAVGRGSDRQHAPSVRNDSTCWLDGSTTPQQTYLTAMAALQQTLNQHFFLGLADYEAHYALYPPGGFYQRHVDSFRGSNPRRVTTVFYLNDNWDAADGGELVIYRDQDDTSGHPIAPTAGTLVVFISENIPHEVKPARRERLSIAGWYRVRS